MPEPVEHKKGLFGRPLMNGLANSTLVFLRLPTAEVEALLPDGIELLPVPPDLVDSEHHMVMLEFNFQKDVLTPVGQHLNYREFILTVPYVTFAKWKQKKAYSYMAVLFLDNLTATIGGWLFWAFPKKLAKIETGDAGEQNYYDVFTPSGDTPHIRGLFTPEGPYLEAGASPPFQALRPMLELPYLEHGWLNLFFTSTYHWLLNRVMIRPIAAKVETADLIGLPERTYNCPSIEKSPIGAFRMEYGWQLTAARPLWKWLRRVVAFFLAIYGWIRRHITGSSGH